MDKYLIFEGGRYAGAFSAAEMPAAEDGVEYRLAPADFDAERDYRLADGEVVEVAAEAAPAEVAGESSAWKKVKSAIGI